MGVRGALIFLSMGEAAIAQDSAVRLPENFVRLDVIKLRQALREAPRVRLADLTYKVVRPEFAGLRQ